MSAPYLLSPHVYLCVAGKQIVLLDLERDKYLALSRSSGIGHRISGWPVNSVEFAPGEEATATLDDDKLMSSMLAKGMLVENSGPGKTAFPVAVDLPQTALVEYDLFVRPRPKAEHFWSMALAFAAARWWLKYRPIGKTVEAARLRRLRAPPAPMCQMESVRELVTSFVHLRPLFYTLKDACLLDSLTLDIYLCRYRVFASWVFGVRTEPFLPHCWIQLGDYVFNDSPDRIKGFSPIMVV